MVLYCICHSANIIRSIVHKFKYHPQDDAAFLVEEDPSSLYCPCIDKIKYYRMPDCEQLVYRSGASQEEIKRYTNETISDCFKGEDLDPLQFSHIYALFDVYNPFILYFEMNSIKYMLIEIVDNWFKICSPGKWLSARAWDVEACTYNHLVVDMHLQDGFGKNCIKGYLFSDASNYDESQGEGNFEVFGFHKSFIGLDENYKRRILDGYNLASCDFDTVVMMNSPGYMKYHILNYGLEMPSKYTVEDKYGDVVYLYKAILDYYFTDADYVLKLHPKSTENFNKAFSEIKQLPLEIPIEIFLLFNKKFDVVNPGKSSGITIFKNHNFNVASFGFPVVDFFKHIHFVFLAFTLINAICIPTNIFVHDIDIRQINYFINWAYKDFKDVTIENLHGLGNAANAEFIVANSTFALSNIIKGSNIINGAPYDCLIIMHGVCREEDRHIFAVQEMTCSLIDISDGKDDVLQRFSWTVLSKNRALLDAIREFSASYTLENAKVRVESLPLT